MRKGKRGTVETTKGCVGNTTVRGDSRREKEVFGTTVERKEKKSRNEFTVQESRIGRTIRDIDGVFRDNYNRGRMSTP